MANYWRVVFDRDAWTRAEANDFQVVGLPEKAQETAGGVQVGDILICCIRQYGSGTARTPAQYTGALQVVRAANRKSGSVGMYGKSYPIGIGTRALAILDEDDRFNVRSTALTGDDSNGTGEGPQRLRGTLKLLDDQTEALRIYRRVTSSVTSSSEPNPEEPPANLASPADVHTEVAALRQEVEAMRIDLRMLITALKDLGLKTDL